MKLIRKGSTTSLKITQAEWVKLGSSNGWLTTSSSLNLEPTMKFSDKLEGLLLKAEKGSIYDLMETPHVILVNAGQDTGPDGFAEVLRKRLEKNPVVQTPKIAKLDTSGIMAQASAERDRVRQSASKILTSGNMIWNLTEGSVSTDSLKLLEENSENFRKSNVWVVVETTD